MTRKIIFFSLLAVLLIPIETVFAKTLFFDDFGGNNLDEKKWQIVNWVGKVNKVTVANSEVVIESAGSARAGILSIPTFNAEKGPITLVAKGVKPEPQSQFDVNFSGKAWEKQIEWVATNAELSTWIIRAGGAPSEAGFKKDGVFKSGESLSLKVDGTKFTFIREGKSVHEINLNEADFKGDFRLFLYCFPAGKAIFGSIEVFDAGGPSAVSVEAAGKLTTAWGKIKGSF